MLREEGGQPLKQIRVQLVGARVQPWSDLRNNYSWELVSIVYATAPSIALQRDIAQEAFADTQSCVTTLHARDHAPSFKRLKFSKNIFRNLNPQTLVGGGVLQDRLHRIRPLVIRLWW